MKNKPLIIIVISVFLIAGILGSEKKLVEKSRVSNEASRTIKVELTPYNHVGSRLGFIDSYRPIYTKKLGHRKSVSESPLRQSE